MLTVEMSWYGGMPASKIAFYLDDQKKFNLVRFENLKSFDYETRDFYRIIFQANSYEDIKGIVTRVSSVIGAGRYYRLKINSRDFVDMALEALEVLQVRARNDEKIREANRLAHERAVGIANRSKGN